MEDDRDGCLKAATTPETVEKVHAVVLDNCKIKVHDIAELSLIHIFSAEAS